MDWSKIHAKTSRQQRGYSPHQLISNLFLSTSSILYFAKKYIFVTTSISLFNRVIKIDILENWEKYKIVSGTFRTLDIKSVDLTVLGFTYFTWSVQSFCGRIFSTCFFMISWKHAVINCTNCMSFEIRSGLDNCSRKQNWFLKKYSGVPI